jgi:GNAT superfamily N-acetyltransferase
LKTYRIGIYLGVVRVLKYQQEFLQQVEGELSELLKRDWKEVQHNSDTEELDIDWDFYKLLEERKALLIFTCRDEGKLVGYFSVFISPNLHSKGKVLLSNDAIFLDKPYRKGFAGIKLIKFAEECLRQDGYDNLQITTTELNPIDSLMLRLGYTKISTSFRKDL